MSAIITLTKPVDRESAKKLVSEIEELSKENTDIWSVHFSDQDDELLEYETEIVNGVEVIKDGQSLFDIWVGDKFYTFKKYTQPKDKTIYILEDENDDVGKEYTWDKFLVIFGENLNKTFK